MVTRTRPRACEGVGTEEARVSVSGEAAGGEEKRILTMDGIIDDAKRRRYYEKPCRRRQRETYEACRSIYNAEMARKISFIARKNRPDPWMGC
nr:PREDICTED: 28S ribosomal protein S21, mitochondrial isoform X1 [Anolis carolinensis]|eukprot:XP_016853855.1 PREDICTED: 28S ribosomal protein S21, mitochondrial isoform X1 [Anolis carolinensis]